MIDDKTEEGRTEEEAVSDLGTAEEIAAQIIEDIPLAKIVKERIKPKRRLKAPEIVLLAVGSPIWLALSVAAVAVILALYAALWSLIIAFWAVFVSVAVCAVASVPSCVISVAGGKVAAGIAMLAGGIICAGLAVFAFYGCKAATRAVLRLTKKLAVAIKKCFIKKEEEK